VFNPENYNKKKFYLLIRNSFTDTIYFEHNFQNIAHLISDVNDIIAYQNIAYTDM
jgi:hypothetical protein